MTVSENNRAAEALAQRFHEVYERLAPSFGYETRKSSAKPWHEVPEQNRQLMVAVCAEIREEFVIVVDLTSIEKRLDRIERLVRTEGAKIMTDIHGEIAEALQPVLDAVEAVSTDVARELADFAAQVAPKLTDAERAQFASLAQKLTDLDTAVNAADPAPETPAV